MGSKACSMWPCAKFFAAAKVIAAKKPCCDPMRQMDPKKLMGRENDLMKPQLKIQRLSREFDVLWKYGFVLFCDSAAKTIQENIPHQAKSMQKNGCQDVTTVSTIFNPQRLATYPPLTGGSCWSSCIASTAQVRCMQRRDPPRCQILSDVWQAVWGNQGKVKLERC